MPLLLLFLRRACSFSCSLLVYCQALWPRQMASIARFSSLSLRFACLPFCITAILGHRKRTHSLPLSLSPCSITHNVTIWLVIRRLPHYYAVIIKRRFLWRRGREEEALKSNIRRMSEKARRFHIFFYEQYFRDSRYWKENYCHFNHH